MDCSPQAPLPMGFPMALVGLVYYYLCDPTADFKQVLVQDGAGREPAISKDQFGSLEPLWYFLEQDGRGITVQKEGFLQELVSGIPQTPVLRSCSRLSTHCQRLHGLCGTQNCRDPLSSRLLQLLCSGQHRSDSGKPCEWEPGWGSVPKNGEGSMRVRLPGLLLRRPGAPTECTHRSVQIHTHTQTTQQSHRWKITAIIIAPVLRIQGQEHPAGLFSPNLFIKQVFAEQ